jgi:hypothetical protein
MLIVCIGNRILGIRDGVNYVAQQLSPKILITEVDAQVVLNMLNHEWDPITSPTHRYNTFLFDCKYLFSQLIGLLPTTKREIRSCKGRMPFI